MGTSWAAATRGVARGESQTPIKAFCIDFNWGPKGINGFAGPGVWADASPEEHVRWYEGLGVNVIQTFAVSCNGYAWYKGGIIPPQPGLKHDFLTEVVRLGQPWFARQLTVRSVGAGQKVLQNLACATPPLQVGPQQAAIFPGSLPVGDTPIASLQKPQWLHPRSNDPLAVLWDATKQRGLGTWYHCEEEFAPVTVRRCGEGAEIRHVQQIVARLNPGQAVTLGKQFFWLAHGSRDEALRGVQQVYRAVELRAPDHRLANLGEMVLYCGHPGGTPEQHFRGYGGFAAIRRDLPTLKRMGIDLLWLLPIWEHGDGKQWNLYAPFDHFHISPLYGTPEELKELSTAAGQSGIRLMFDLVPHGPPDFTPLAKEHPEWISLDANGKRQYAWGEYAFDNAHPGWQDYMRRAAQWDAQQYGAVGARVDCGAT